MAFLLSHTEKVLPDSSGKYQKLYSDDEEIHGKSSAPQPDIGTSTSKSSTDSEQVSLPPPRRRRFTSITFVLLFLCFSVIAGSAFWVLSRLFQGPTTNAADASPLAQTSATQLKAYNNGTTEESHESHFRKAIVVASFSNQNVDWLADIPSDWEVARYILDDPNPYHALTVPRNQGREAMAYLTYIIDNYDDFPDAAVFVHGHFRSWHQPEKVTNKIKAVNMTALQQEKYFSLRCTAAPGCDQEGLNTVDPIGNHDALMHIRAWWSTIFPPEAGNETFTDGGPRQTGELPVMVRGKCCAQFAVSREAVLSMPKDIWKRIRAPLLRDTDDFAAWGDGVTSHTLGLLYEPVWHIIFGKSGDHCPSEDYCRKVFFSDAIACDHYTTFGETEDMAHCHSIFDDDKSHILGETTGQGVPSEPKDDQSTEEMDSHQDADYTKGSDVDIPPPLRRHVEKRRQVSRKGGLKRQPISHDWAQQYLKAVTSHGEDEDY